MLAACQKSDVNFVKTLRVTGADVDKEDNDLFKYIF